ncbi:hypothetical protein [Deinococcus rubellus]|uniref:Uncharacterized protein n=1 Tax=Deinococcus rubellus TaxID=1889240 RepID=A0ABY5YHM9_9DEIO|nr:hypothetical protein [Deinococcus rubellus]UWX64288.1 hypothetical protein N0D28_01015 [Deinococcus rubellus]
MKTSDVSESSTATLEGMIGSMYEINGLQSPESPMLLSVLSDLATFTDYPLQKVIHELHGLATMRTAPAPTLEDFYNDVPMPKGLTKEGIKAALDATQEMMAVLNHEIKLFTGKYLHELIQGNNYSGLVSNLLTVAIGDHTIYKPYHDQKHPDLMNDIDNIGLEIKASNKVAKGGEGHNGTNGWHMIACYNLNQESGQIQFTHIEIAELNGMKSTAVSDWKYVGSNVNEEGTQRTETYTTTPEGTWKLRHGSVYINSILWPNWSNLSKQAWRGGEIPQHSPWYKSKSI